MNYILLGFIVVFWIIFIMVVPQRVKMTRRAKALLKEMPNHESTSVYLQLSSGFPHEKKREIDAKVAEVTEEGWVFLKAGEVNPLKTLRSWGGAINLYFIRDITD